MCSNLFISSEEILVFMRLHDKIKFIIIKIIPKLTFILQTKGCFENKIILQSFAWFLLLIKCGFY